MAAGEGRRYKPAPEPYRLAAERLGESPGALTMVAADAKGATYSWPRCSWAMVINRHPGMPGRR